MFARARGAFESQAIVFHFIYPCVEVRVQPLLSSGRSFLTDITTQTLLVDSASNPSTNKSDFLFLNCFSFIAKKSPTSPT
jgi:hypothetical protein